MKTSKKAKRHRLRKAADTKEDDMTNSVKDMPVEEAEDTRPVIVHDGKEKRINLTPEQAAKVCYTGIYKADPEDFRDYKWISRYWDTSGKYHCRNWCFKVSVNIDGDLSFVDTYWGSTGDNRFLVTSEEFDKLFPRFKLIMDDKSNYRYISREEAEKYDPSDIVEAAFDSGGWTYGKTTWIRNDATPPVRRELAQALRKSRSELRSLFSTSSAAYELRGLQKQIEKVREAGLSFDDSDEMAKRDEFFETLDTEKTTLGAAANGDFARWLKEDAYCPGEIYSPDGFSYRLFDAEDEALKFARGKFDNGNIRECFLVPSRDSIVLVASDTDDKAYDALHCDATEDNIRSCIDFVAGDGELELNEFSPWHYSSDAEEIAEKLEKAIEALEALRKEFVM